MRVDELFSVNNPDGYLESARSVGRIAAYMCSVCGSFVARDYLEVHTEMHNHTTSMDDDIYTLNKFVDTRDWS